MLPARRQPDRPPSRAPWVVSLAFGLTSPALLILAVVANIAVGLGYDLFMGGKMPHPLVLMGLSMLSIPFLAYAKTAHREYVEQLAERERDALPSPSMTTMRRLSEATGRHGVVVVEHFIASALDQLDEQVEEKHATIRQLDRGDDDVHGR